MHLRRALLLFAIVLGFAAVAASLAPPPEQDSLETPTGPGPLPAESEPAPAASEVRFVTGASKPGRRTLAVGERAVVTVAVEHPGQVAIEGLGLLQAAEPGTPARFDLLPVRPGRFEVTFRPVEGGSERVAIVSVEA